MSKKVQNWAVPLIAVLLGMLIGAVLMLIFGSADSDCTWILCCI